MHQKPKKQHLKEHPGKTEAKHKKITNKTVVFDNFGG